MHVSNVVAIDLETRDDRLSEGLGTGCWYRENGEHIFMLGINDVFPQTYAWDDMAKQTLREMLDEGRHWVGANLKYDLNWLLSEGVLKRRHLHNNTFHDVLLYAALLDETQDWQYYSLDGQCLHYGLPTKPIEPLLAAAGTTSKKIAMSKLWQLPRDLVADYLRHDVTVPKQILEYQLRGISEQKLERVAEMEMKLLPVICLMEQKGVPVDEAAALELQHKIGSWVDEQKTVLRARNGGNDVPLAKSIALVEFVENELGHTLPKTEKGNPKMDAAVLTKLGTVDPYCNIILQARKAEKIQTTFCRDVIEKYAQRGRIHANVNQLVGGDEQDKKTRGVKYGRFSYSQPNLQQIPKRDSVELAEIGGLGKAMRKLFIAETGRQFLSADFAAQEPRWIVHWAETWGLPGAKRVGDMYRNDPTVSSHDIVAAALDIPNMGHKQKRTVAKEINLGKGYEMGRTKLVEMLVAVGAPADQVDGILEMFEKSFPHVRLASRAAMKAAKDLGYVRTYLGRKSNFHLWVPINGRGEPLREEAAKERYALGKRAPIERYKTYTAFNRVVQGSSGDQSKMAIVELFYVHGIVPSLQIHDELCDADADNETATIYKHVMENVIQLTVPNLVEIKLGGSWGG